MPTYEFWQHEKSGDIYAVQLNEQGEAEAACGPILYTECLPHNLPEFDYSEEAGEWIHDWAHEFNRAADPCKSPDFSHED